MKKEMYLLDIIKESYDFKRCKSCKNINHKDNKLCCHCGDDKFNKNGSYVIGAMNSYARNGKSYDYEQNYCVRWILKGDKIP